MACQLPEAISKIEEILLKNGESIDSTMLSGFQINMLNEAKSNLESAVKIRMARMQGNTSGYESNKKINSITENETINIYSGDINGYEKLSNFNAGPITLNGKLFKTLEHAFQYWKASLASSDENKEANRNKIMNSPTGLAAQQAGRSIKIDSKNWTEAESNIALSTIMKKYYSENKEAMSLLKTTGSKELTHIGKNGIKLDERFTKILTEIRNSSSGSESKRPEFDKLPSYKEGQKNMVYAGVGSRETPVEIQQAMNDVAKELESAGYTLRSGNAIGADKAFEGAPQPWSKDSKGSVNQWSKYSHKVKNKEIFKAESATDKTRKIAKEIHANHTALNGVGLDLMARNTNQVFGKNLDTPVDFVLAWTPLNEQGKPVTKHEDKSYDKDKKAKKARGEETFDTGGTGQAISYASLNGIPVINMADKNWRQQLDETLSKNKTKSQVETKPSEPEIKYGSAVKYKPENGTEGYYIVRGITSNGGVQLTDTDGKNFSGTPKIDKVKFVKQLEIKTYNKVDYIVDSNNRIYTSNGEVVSKTYVDRLLNEFIETKSKQNDGNKQENKQNENENKTNNKYELFPNVYANEDQENAIDDIKEWYKSNESNTYLLKGRGGTGKTTIVGEVIKQLGIDSKRVVFAAFSNKAVKVLLNANKDSKYKGSKYLTTAQILKLKPVRDVKTGKQKFVTDAYAEEKITSSDKVIVIDEASMLPNKQQKEIEAKAKNLGIKIIYMGDDVQLPPVDEFDINGKAVKEALVFNEHKKTGDVSELTKRMRQKGESPILPVTDVLANAVKNELDPNKIVFEQGTEINNGQGVVFLNKNAGELDIMEMFLKDFKKDQEGTKFIHYNASDNEKTKIKNDIIRRELYGKDFNLPENKYMKGEQVIFDNGYFYQDEKTGNNISIDGATEAKVLESHIVKNKPINYFHGRQKRTIKLDVYSVTVQENDSDGVGYIHEIDIPFNINRLEEIIDLEKKDLGVYPGGLKDSFASISYSYVITSHKSQGSTYNNAYVDIGNIFGIKATDNDTKLKSAYVATSRPRNKLVLIGANTSGKTVSVDEAIEITKEDSQAYNPQSEPGVEFELVKETANEIKSNIKNSNGNIVGEIKIRHNSTIKDELYRSDIRVSKTKIPKKLLDSKIVMIDDVYIEDDFKRSGYGLKTIEKIKKDYDGSIIMLDAYPTQGNLSKDELIKFYKKSGFKVLEKLNDDTVTFMYADLTGTDVGNNFVYKTISKDDIEAAKDIMSNNKKECE